MCHGNEEWCEFWRRIDLSIQNWHEEFDAFWPEHLKVSEVFILMCSFRTKYILFELKKCRGVIYNQTGEGYKIWKGIDLLFRNWHKKVDKFWPEHLKVSYSFTLMGSFLAKYVFFELRKYRGVIFDDIVEWWKI